jgi:hypothetical protein
MGNDHPEYGKYFWVETRSRRDDGRDPGAIEEGYFLDVTEADGQRFVEVRKLDGRLLGRDAISPEADALRAAKRILLRTTGKRKVGFSGPIPARVRPYDGPHCRE